MSNKLLVDPLFVGLTRPSMIFGVSIQFALLNMLVCVFVFIQTTSVFIIFFAGVMHLIGYILCFKEPRFMEIYQKKFAKCNQCYNKRFYGSNSYGL